MCQKAARNVKTSICSSLQESQEDRSQRVLRTVPLMYFNGT